MPRISVFEHSTVYQSGLKHRLEAVSGSLGKVGASVFPKAAAREPEK